MASSRASEVAEILWELKRAGKVATYTDIASRAGFSAGANGRTILTCLKTVRKDWPHLQWWRAITDDGSLGADPEHGKYLSENGYEIEVQEGRVTIKSFETHRMRWDALHAEAVE